MVLAHMCGDWPSRSVDDWKSGALCSLAFARRGSPALETLVALSGITVSLAVACGAVVAISDGYVAVTRREDQVVNLIAFIGRRVSVVEVPNVPPEGYIAMDRKFTARYEVLDVIYGNYESDDIEFAAYDHYGSPAFAGWDVVLLYVSRYDDGLVHQRYLFHPVFPTASGRWAACGDLYFRRRSGDEWLDGEPESSEIDFVPLRLTHIPKGYNFRDLYHRRLFSGNRLSVLCKDCGVYAEQLFQMDRKGVLKARNVFE